MHMTDRERHCYGVNVARIPFGFNKQAEIREIWNKASLTALHEALCAHAARPWAVLCLLQVGEMMRSHTEVHSFPAATHGHEALPPLRILKPGHDDDIASQLGAVSELKTKLD